MAEAWKRCPHGSSAQVSCGHADRGGPAGAKGTSASTEPMGSVVMAHISGGTGGLIRRTFIVPTLRPSGYNFTSLQPARRGFMAPTESVPAGFNSLGRSIDGSNALSQNTPA